MELARRNIVITGGTSGIGYELVRLLRHRNQVLVVASNANRLQGLGRTFPDVLTEQADLSIPTEVTAVADRIKGRFPGIDLLINNAAVQYEPTLLDAAFDVDSIPREIGVNLTALCSLTAMLLPALLTQRQAAIVNVNSGLGLAPKTHSAIYCATKAGVNVFSQSLRYQLQHTNVDVLQAFMPLVDTAMTAGRGSGKMSAADAAAELVSGVERGIADHDIGKVKLLRLMLRYSPGVARRIMKAA